MEPENNHQNTEALSVERTPLFRWKGSLFQQISLAILLITGFSVAALTSVSIHRQSAALKEYMIRTQGLISDQVTFAVRNALFSPNWVYYVERVLETAIEEWPDLLWIAILRPDGDTYLGVGDLPSGERARGKLLMSSGGLSGELTREITREEGQTYSVLRPISIAKETWLLSMGLSLGHIQSMKRDLIANHLQWGGVVLLLGCLISFFLSKKISRPIGELLQATERITTGELDQPLSVSSNDEMAVLIRSFNGMQERLSQFKEELTESEEKFRSISASAQDGILMLDQDGAIAYMNRAAEEIFGYSQSEVLGKQADLLGVPGRYRESFNRGFARFKEAGQLARAGMTSEYRAMRKDGTEFPAELSLSTLTFKGKWYAVAILRDISQRKATEEALHAAKESAEAANRAKSEFLANMSHEIRTPLNGVIGMLGLLEEASLEEELADYVKLATISAETLLSVISDILDFSKIEAGRMDLEERSFDLKEEISRLMGLLARKAENRAVEVATRFEGDIPRFVVGDPVRFRQVIFNLVGNSLKFTPEGHVWLDVRLKHADETSATLEICVTDTGIGIPKDKMDTIFDHFTQADASTTRKYGGTGLGLAICRQLVHLMGGELHATSLPGVQTRFQFDLTLPIDREAVSHAKEHPGEPSLLSEENQRPFGLQELPGAASMRVLLVEDNEINQKAALAILGKLGFRKIAVAENGLIALDMLTHADVDLILMDVQMPYLDGFETSRRIRELKGKVGKAPIIALTANAVEGDREKCLAAGMNDYISKPIQKELLVEKLKGWLGRPGRATNEWSREKPGEKRTGGPEEFPTFAREETIARYDHDLELLKGIMHDFIEKTSSSIVEMWEALDLEDCARVGSKAHALKGGASYMGATRLQHIALAVEFSGRAGDVAATAGLLPELQQEFERFKEEIGRLEWKQEEGQQGNKRET